MVWWLLHYILTSSFSGLGGTAFAFVGTICAWFVTAKVGRRTVYIFGEAASCCLLVIIGSIAAGANEGPGLWAQAAFALVWIFTYAVCSAKRWMSSRKALLLIAAIDHCWPRRLLYRC